MLGHLARNLGQLTLRDWSDKAVDRRESAVLSKALLSMRSDGLQDQQEQSGRQFASEHADPGRILPRIKAGW